MSQYGGMLQPFSSRCSAVMMRAHSMSHCRSAASLMRLYVTLGKAFDPSKHINDEQPVCTDVKSAT